MDGCRQIADYYKKQGAPADQTALVAMLREVQNEEGALSKDTVRELAAYLQVKESFLMAIIRRIPSLRLEEAPVLELCGGPNCGKNTALAAAAERLCAHTETKLRYMPCMRLCGKGPNLKYDGRLYHKADEALLKQLLGSKEEKRK